ncbi:MAG: hypothetical protein WAZ12_03420 [Candidatus Absconditicoccaceae bacterium]
MAKKLLRIEEIILLLTDSEDILVDKIAKILSTPVKVVSNFEIVKKAIDSRDKKNILFVYSVNVKFNDRKILAHIGKNMIKRHKIRFVDAYVYKIKTIDADGVKYRPIVVGSGPSGLFAALVLATAGLKPLLIERGVDVDTRAQDVEQFLHTGKLNTNSNVQFGEGGAGTFSDGKLYTGVNNPRTKYIFEELILAGAPKEIMYDAHPHIGTDKLKDIVKNLREKIIALGGGVRFATCLTDIEIKNNKIIAAIFNKTEKIPTDDLVLAIGHSARDTYEMLYKNKLNMQQKTFAMGLRIEHPRELINHAQFGDDCTNSRLPTASYKLVSHQEDDRSVYTFCMCPGGYIIAASSEEGKLAINGMSEYNQDSPMSNSALLVGVNPSDFGSDHPLAGIEFQRKREEKAFVAGGSNYNAPAQLVGDFLQSKASTKIASMSCTYRPGINLTSLDQCLPSYIISAIKKAIPFMDKKIKGFANPDAILVGIESRSSSVVRLVRDEKYQSNIAGIYPAGEGSGYAGGIASSAIDGLAVAEAIIEKYSK